MIPYDDDLSESQTHISAAINYITRLENSNSSIGVTGEVDEVFTCFSQKCIQTTTRSLKRKLSEPNIWSLIEPELNVNHFSYIYHKIF